ncbi:type I polyketide synthase [Rhodococcoides fascians]|uniref:type I polyketide synthase n=1 Tax=Rhodococcoides fascians TaxID=1828 RepID=UPI00068BCCB7|nr:type I polyketide synthase [Rhodococcus fascians]
MSDLTVQHATNSPDRHAATVDPIAIVGIGCRFPGGVDSPDALWNLLASGGDAVSEVPPERWAADDVYDAQPGVLGRTVSRWGGFLDNIGGFDTTAFGITEYEAEAMDPQHRLLTQMSWEALEHAGIAPGSLKDSQTGVFFGLAHHDYLLRTFDDSLVDNPYVMTGNAHSVGAGRVSYLLGLHGPSVAVDTACSSGLLSVHLGCQSLRSGETDLVLAGAAMLQLGPEVGVLFSQWSMLSPNGRCAAFDAAADGFVRSEGCAVIALKRLDDAERDGDRVLAVIRGSAANSDGRSDNIVVPSASAQEAVQRSALRVAGVDPSDVEFVEAHGPGTPTGDPVEFQALSAVYGNGDTPCALGSVKTNIGHTESVSGLAGLIKTVMSLRNKQIPGNLHFTSWNPDISSEDTRLYVPTELTEWDNPGSPRLAAVSSYGFSGTNVHVVVGEAAATAPSADEPADSTTAQPILLSASTPQALAQTAGRVAQWLTGPGAHASLTDIGTTLARHREHRTERLVALAASHEELTDQLRSIAALQPATGVVSAAIGSHGGAPVWVFSGQGSQWAGMGRELLSTEPAFAAMIDELEPLIAREAGFSVRGELVADETVTGIEKIQPTIFAVQVALAAAWRSRGVEPAAVIGHSLGEAAASVVAGALTLDDGVKVICRRSQLVTRIAGGGAMATIELPHLQVAAELEAAGIDDVTVAVIVSPTSTVVAGDPARVKQLVTEWDARDLHARTIAVDYASHSPHVDSILDDVALQLECLAPDAAKIPVYSTVLEDPRKPAAFDAGYWVDNLRRPVRFADAVTAAVLDGHRIFVELSPHPLLTYAITETATSIGRDATAIGTLRRDGDQSLGLLPQLSDLHCSGVTVDWERVYPSGQLVDVPLPTWAGEDLGVLALHVKKPGASVDAHPLLGVHMTPIDADDEHRWQATMSGRDLQYLDDHQVHDQPALPGASYCEMGLVAAQSVFAADLGSVEITDLVIHEMLHLHENTVVSSRTRPEGHESVRFESLTRHDGDASTLLASGTLRIRPPVEPERLDVAELLASHPTPLDTKDAYAKFHGAGVHHGAAFAAMTALHLSDDTGTAQTVFAEVSLPATARSQVDAYSLHPVLMDGCLQTLASHPALIRDAFPTGVGSLRVHRNPHHARYCLAQLHHLDEQLAIGGITLLDEDGTVVAEATGVRLATADRRLAERLLTVEWERADLPAPQTQAGRWLVLTEASTTDPLTVDLAAALGNDIDIRAFHTDSDALDADLAAHPPHQVVVLCAPPTNTADHDTAQRAQDRIRQLIELVRVLVERTDTHRPRLWVVTHDAQRVGSGDGRNLEQTAVRGLCRVIGHEHPELGIRHLDVSSPAEPTLVAQILLADDDADEIALRDGELFLARLKVAPLRDNERRHRPIRFGRDRYALAPQHAGDLGSLELVATTARPPAADEIEIAVEALGVNYADVLNAMGLYKTVDGAPMPFGFDCAGTVVSTGSSVTTFRPGDRVAAMHPGVFESFAVVPACKVNRLPDDVTFAAAAARPSVFATAWYGLHRLSRIRPGERVLIHSATGGVGLAAIAVARHLGATIYATAGTAAKRQYLRDMGIERVFNSRSTAFAEQIRDVTGGEGVDVVLNSLTGAAQRAGLDLLRIGGRFVELGKKDIYADSKIGLFPFRRNISLHSFDLGVLPYDELGDVLREVHELLASGALTPTPHTTYPLSDASTAFRTLAAGDHIGKLVLTVPQDGEGHAAIRPDDVPVIRADGSYVVTGGLGGLGLILARWFAEHGAGRVVLNGRSAPSVEAMALIDELRSGGTDIEIVRGDIAIGDTATDLVRAATATGLPLRGVIHAAAVVDDAAITTVDDALMERVWAPKVHGALKMHEACAHSELDWWFGFSSASALVGFAGQACYASANALLDGLTMWRRDHGLPALSVNWGAWAEYGRGTMFADRGNAMIDPDEGLHACDALLRYDRPRAGYLPILDPGWQSMLADKLRTSSFFAAIPADRGAERGIDLTASTSLAELQNLEPPAQQRFLESILTAHAAEILRVDAAALDPDRSLGDHGLDSLMALELSTRINREFDIRVTPKQMRQDSSPAALALHIAAQLNLEAVQ